MNKNLSNEIADLQALCARAYSVLSEDYDKLRDTEGYGPISLLRDLEKAKDGRQVKDITLLNEQLHKALEETLVKNKKLSGALEYITGFTQCPETEAEKIIYDKASKVLEE